MLGMKILQATIEKKAVSAACRRDFAWLAVCEKQCSQRKASTYVRLHRSTLRYQSKFPFAKKEEADAAIVDLSLEHPDLGSDKVDRLVCNQGFRVSRERVRQVRCEECLQVPPPKKKKSHRGTSIRGHPTKAKYRGHVWTWDLIYDSSVKGGNFRTLSVIDEGTREASTGVLGPRTPLQLARGLARDCSLEAEIQ